MSTPDLPPLTEGRFGVDDATVRELSEASRLIGAGIVGVLDDPAHPALPEAMAALLLIRERRTRPGVSWETVRDYPLGAILAAIDPSTSTADGIAQAAADDLTGGEDQLDPSDRPA